MPVKTASLLFTIVLAIMCQHAQILPSENGSTHIVTMAMKRKSSLSMYY